MGFLKGYTTLFGLYKRRFLTDLNFKLRYLTKNFVKKFYDFRYMRGRAKSQFRESSRIIKNFCRIYFLLKYNKVKRLKRQLKPYSAY